LNPFEDSGFYAILTVHAPTVPATFLRLMRSLVYWALI